MIDQAPFSIPCTGDVVTGDTVLFEETVWPPYKPQGRFKRKKPCPLGSRVVVAYVVSESYGAGKQQHTFTLKIIKSEGTEPLKFGSTTRRKGRNLYREGTSRLPWTDESERKAVADEKHQRGDNAREAREERRAIDPLTQEYLGMF